MSWLTGNPSQHTVSYFDVVVFYDLDIVVCTGY